jgi:hypothetical protein
MNALVKKEIRLLLPGFLTGLALTFSTWLLPDNSTGFRAALVVFPFLLCPAMAVMMALDSFGAEISFGTFSNLLAQPVPRARIWQVKILLLAAALTILGVFWCATFYLRFAPFKDPTDFWNVLVIAWLLLLVVFSGGVWAVLLLRQVAAAFWFTLLTPGAILVLTISLTAGLSDVVSESVLVAVLGIYTLLGFGFARWLFLRVQDTQWTGGTIAMPEMGGISLWAANSGMARRWRPRAALLWKEVQLHQAQFIVAGVLALLHLGVLATRHLGHFRKNSSTEFILESFWWLWLVMPLLVGCAAIAEERKMGTLDGQLCLPVKRRTQFIIKLLVVLLLAIGLGFVMPLLLEGHRILPEFKLNFAWNLMHDNVGVASVWGQLALNLLAGVLFSLPWLAIAGIAVGIAAVAFYASTLARNTLQALAPAVLGLLLTWFLLMVAAMPYEFGLGFLWRGPLIFLIVTPVLAVILAGLAYRNCQQVRVGGKVWGRNLLTLGITLALVTATTSAIYHRAWERLTPIEPPHGTPRWTTAHPPRMEITSQNDITIYLPDGRVWMNRYDAYAENPFAITFVKSRMFGGGKFLASTNWTDVLDCWRDIVGIQRDGSLWVSQKPDNFQRGWKTGKNPVSQATELARFGSENDWKSVSGRFITMPLLLKTDGTLWLWGTNHWKWTKLWPGLHAFTPQRMGTNADWENVFFANGRTYFCKTNGQVWAEPAFSETDEKLDLGYGRVLSRAPYLENKKWKDVAYLSQVNWMPFLAGVFEDGSFREIAEWNRIPITPEISKDIRTSSKNHSTWEFIGRDVRIGTETNWLALTDNNGTTTTLKSDGSLWKWDFSRPSYVNRAEPLNLFKISPNPFSIHSDWVAIGRMMDGIVTLAADGSLWLWRFDPPIYYGGDNYPALLGVSRRPQFLGNVFDTAK